MIENEFKVMLDRERFEKLCELYSWDKVVRQTNYYYDTEDFFLSKNRITCRVRKIDGECFLQIKLPTNAEFSRVELEQKLGADVPETLSAEQLNALAAGHTNVAIPDVKLLGALVTERRIKEFDGAEIDLDKSEYFGKTDYELEIEFTDENAAREILAQCRQAVDLEDGGDVCTGKIHRFMDEYRRTEL
jgi:uncharacterized protein YjbK